MAKNYKQKQDSKPVCDEDCFDYGMFGGEECCGAGRYFVPMQPGQKCLHPDLRYICKPIGTVSTLEFCAALEGQPIRVDSPKSGFEDLGQVTISVGQEPKNIKGR